MKDRLFAIAERTGGFALARKLTKNRLRILCYHGLWTSAAAPYGDRLFMPAAQFERRMRWLASTNYPVLDLGEAVERLAENTLPANATVITIDDGWSSTYRHMLPVLQTFSLPATCYVTTYYAEKEAPVMNVALGYIVERAGTGTITVGDLAEGLPETLSLTNGQSRKQAVATLKAAFDEMPVNARTEALVTFAERAGVDPADWYEERQFHLMTPHEVGDAAARGLDIQLHTHRHRGLHHGTDTLAAEIETNRNALQRMIGNRSRLDHFCYPSGGYQPAGEAILAAAGVRSATLVDEGINPPGTNPYRLRRFLDGRSVAERHVGAYLSGALDLLERVR